MSQQVGHFLASGATSVVGAADLSSGIGGRPYLGHDRTRSGRRLLAVLAVVVIIALAIALARAGDSTRQWSAAPSTAPGSVVPRLSDSGLGEISRDLGGRVPAYFARATASGYVFDTGRGATAALGRGGLTLVSGSVHVRLRLASHLSASSRGVAPERSIMRRNLVRYARPGLSEWYVNQPSGLEQGFLVRDNAALAGLSFAVSGNATAKLSGGGRGVRFRSAGGREVRESELHARDATGKVLAARFVLRGRELQIKVDAAGARFPVSVDPLLQQGPAMSPGDMSGQANFGAAISVSSDGNTALIGGFYNGEGPGAAWVYVRSGITWSEQTKLAGSSEIGLGEFGQYVALSADGNTAVVAASKDSSGAGAVWFFTRSGTTWSAFGSKTKQPGTAESGAFGCSVALSGDGKTSLIGACSAKNGVGSAWVFTRGASSFTVQGSALPSVGEVGKGLFGSNDALSSDGNTALVSAINDNSEHGAFWTFTRSGTTWTALGSKVTAIGET